MTRKGEKVQAKQSFLCRRITGRARLRLTMAVWRQAVSAHILFLQGRMRVAVYRIRLCTFRSVFHKVQLCTTAVGSDKIISNRARSRLLCRSFFSIHHSAFGAHEAANTTHHRRSRLNRIKSIRKAALMTMRLLSVRLSCFSACFSWRRRKTCCMLRQQQQSSTNTAGVYAVQCLYVKLF